MVKPLADQMVDLSRKVSKFISQHPREKISRAARHSSPHPSCRAALTTRRAERWRNPTKNSVAQRHHFLPLQLLGFSAKKVRTLTKKSSTMFLWLNCVGSIERES
jgi:hypothetical protein